MRTIRYSNRFKRDYKREKAGRYSKQLDTALAEIVQLLMTDVPLPRRNFDHPLSADGLFRRRSSRDAGAEPPLDVLDDDLLEIGGDGWAT
jgi:mRNA-degrading endonuclease YafQ of YafQ-DinJ toxin-antitoxin module